MYIPLNAEPSEYWLLTVIVLEDVVVPPPLVPVPVPEPDVEVDCVVLYTAVSVVVPVEPIVTAWSLVVVPSDQWLK
jgi:hypothetical protein